MSTSYWSGEIRSIRGLRIENHLPAEVQSLCYYRGMGFLVDWFDVYPSVRFIELLDDVEAVHVLMDLLQDEHADVRWFAAQVLGEYGREGANAIPSLREMLNDKEKFVRAHAASALQKIEIDVDTTVEARAR
jgi:hypothetical protein